MYLRNAKTKNVVLLTDDTEIGRLTAQRFNNKPMWEVVSQPQAVAAGVATSTAKNRALSAVAPAVATVGADASTAIGVVEVAGTVIKAEYYPAASKSGADTNSRTLTIVNGVTTLATLALTNGVNLTAATSKDMGSISNPTVAKGDTLTFKSTHVGSGISDPGGTVVVTYTAT